MRTKLASALRAVAARIDPPPKVCDCGNVRCNGVRYRPLYERDFVPCPLKAVQADREAEMDRLHDWLFEPRV